MKRLGDLLIDAGLITVDQLERALELQKESGKRLGEILVDLGYVTEDQVLEVLSKQLGYEVIDLYDQTIPEDVLKLVPVELIEKYQIFPVRVEGDTLVLAMVDPLNLMAIDDVRLATGYEVKPMITSSEAIKAVYDRYFGVVSEAKKHLKEYQEERIKKGYVVEDLKMASGLSELDDAPIVKLVETIITGAVNYRASDIHLEPRKDRMDVRYRVDGILHKIMEVPKHAQNAVIARIKILSGMDTAERRRPQDGRIETKIMDREIDIRVASIPTVYGEKVVLRILDKSSAKLSLTELGFSEEELKKWLKLISYPHGIILMTGPTGSGKTTTLYASLNKLATEEVNIMTIEEPVEYMLDPLNQVAVNRKVGLTFASALREFLRLDPDIILVGEIRDLETAEVAIQASLTGHLVFSTLHTNDAPTAITRLDNMGVEPYLIAASVIGVAAQRLVRLLCPHCKKSYKPSKEELEYIEPFLPPDKDPDSIVLYKPVGCKFCNNLGYKGREAITEMMIMSPALRELTVKRAPADQIKLQAMKEGMSTLFESGIRKVLEGKTTLEEVFRVVPPEERNIPRVKREVEVEKKISGGLAEAPGLLAPLIT